MAEALELHVVTEQKEGFPYFSLLLIGERFHPHDWIAERQDWGPNYRRIPKFGGDPVIFDGGPYQQPEDYGNIVVGLRGVMEQVTALKVMTIRQTRLTLDLRRELWVRDRDPTSGPYQLLGPKIVEGVRETIREATGRYVHIEGDPHAYAVMDFNTNVGGIDDHGPDPLLGEFQD